MFGCQTRRQHDVAPIADELVKRGDEVVVEQTAADFFEGLVLAVDGNNLKVQRSDGGELLQVGRADVYRLNGKVNHFGRNAFAICEVSPRHWSSCRVIRESNGNYLVEDAAGNQLTLSGSHLLVPTALSSLNIGRRFDDTTRRRHFEVAVQNAGAPRRPAGFRPAPKRPVLAEQNGRWHSGVILEVDDERVTVRWEGRQDVSDVPGESVVPQPPGCGTVARGDYALRRPAGQGGPWSAVLVVSVDGTEVTIEDIERMRSQIDRRDLCPLGNPKPEDSTETTTPARH